MLLFPRKISIKMSDVSQFKKKWNELKASSIFLLKLIRVQKF